MSLGLFLGLDEILTPEFCMRWAEESGVPAVLKLFGDKNHVRLPMSSSFLDMPVDELALSVRSRNALMRANLDTIGKLVNYIREDDSMSGIRNLGKKSIFEVKTVLTEAAYNQLTEQERISFWNYVRRGTEVKWKATPFGLHNN